MMLSEAERLSFIVEVCRTVAGDDGDAELDFNSVLGAIARDGTAMILRNGAVAHALQARFDYDHPIWKFVEPCMDPLDEEDEEDEEYNPPSTFSKDEARARQMMLRGHLSDAIGSLYECCRLAARGNDVSGDWLDAEFKLKDFREKLQHYAKQRKQPKKVKVSRPPVQLSREELLALKKLAAAALARRNKPDETWNNLEKKHAAAKTRTAAGKGSRAQ